MNSYQAFLQNVPENNKAEYREFLQDYEFRMQLFMNDLIAQFIHAMNERGISSKELAERVGVSKSAISQFLHARDNTSIKTIFKLMDALGFTIDFAKSLPLTEVLNSSLGSEELYFEEENKQKYSMVSEPEMKDYNK